jgi:hypothetical protein
VPLLAGLALSIGFAGRVIPLSGVAATSALCVGWQFGEHVEAGLRGEIGLLADRIRDPNFALAAPFAAYVIWRATPEGRLQLALEADAGGVQLASDKLGKTVVGAAQGWAGVEVRAFDQVGFLLLAGGGVAFYLQPPPGESAVQAILGTRAGVVLRF